MPTTDPPISIAITGIETAYPEKRSRSKRIQVPATPAQIGQTRNGRILLAPKTMPLITSTEIVARIIAIELNEQD